MIRPCTDADFDVIASIINEAAEAYRGVIPPDRWHEPYMPKDELRREIEAGVKFWGFEQDGQLLGVMGTQDVQDVTLIRHAYVRTAHRSHGVGGNLLAELRAKTTRPILIGTWADATWAIRFYEKQGFRQVTPAEKDRLLKRYWSIPERQVKTSVVLADEKWFSEMIQPGRYRHYKGKEYEVIGIARHSETLEELVVYRALYGDHGLWVRPRKMFEESVEVDGRAVPRFEFVGKA